VFLAHFLASGLFKLSYQGIERSLPLVDGLANFSSMQQGLCPRYMSSVGVVFDKLTLYKV
jgi:hypothetical protein